MVAIIWLASGWKGRIDATSSQRHTLADDTFAALAQLERPVSVRFYFPKADNELPVPLRRFGEQVEAMLQTVQKAAGKEVIINFLDSSVDPEATESAVLDGLDPVPLPRGGEAYLGLAFESGVDRVLLPQLVNSGQGLEYEIVSRLRKVARKRKSTVGLLTSLPIALKGQEWQLVRQLREHYDLVDLAGEDAIPDEVDLILIVHPRAVGPAFDRRLDEFTAKGGHLVVLMDAVSLSLSFSGVARSLDDLTSDWLGLERATGLEFSAGKTVADQVFATQLDRGEGLEVINTILTMGPGALNAKHPITAGVTKISFPVSGAFSGTVGEGLIETPLVTSTKNSALQDGEIVMTADKRTLAQLYSTFQSDPEKYRIGLLLEGRAASFATGDPRPDIPSGRMVLFGDTDFIADPYAGKGGPGQGGGAFQATNHNLAMVLNVCDFLLADSLLNAARSRARQDRPLSKLYQKELAAQKPWLDQLASVEAELQQLQKTGSNANLRQSAAGGRVDLTFQKDQLARSERLRTLQAQAAALRSYAKEERNFVRSRIQWLNVLAVPLLIVMVAMVRLALRYRRTSPQS